MYGPENNVSGLFFFYLPLRSENKILGLRVLIRAHIQTDYDYDSTFSFPSTIK